MRDLILDTLLDTAKLLPFLFLTYLAMEAIEHRMGDRAKAVIAKSGRFGPLLGGLLGVVPQCGFSAAASGLYAGRVITLGTLLSIYLSTSDEMLPILISERASASTILPILGLKALLGMAAGFAIDLIFRRRRSADGEREAICDLCGRANCRCGERGIFRSALYHTLQVAVFILLITFALNLALHFVGEGALRSALMGRPVLGVLLSALIGLIPNCAASVAITTLYLEGLMSFGAMMAGLLTSAGLGLLVLFRVNRHLRENLTVVALLYASGALLGLALEALGVAF